MQLYIPTNCSILNISRLSKPAANSSELSDCFVTLNGVSFKTFSVIVHEMCDPGMRNCTESYVQSITEGQKGILLWVTYSNDAMLYLSSELIKCSLPNAILYEVKK